MIALIDLLIIAGVVLGLVPMEPVIKNIVVALVVILALLTILSLFGLLPVGRWGWR